MSRRPKLPTSPRRLDPENRAIVGDDDFEPVIPGDDPNKVYLAIADNDGNIIVSDDNRTSVLVED